MTTTPIASKFKRRQTISNFYCIAMHCWPCAAAAAGPGGCMCNALTSQCSRENAVEILMKNCVKNAFGKEFLRCSQKNYRQKRCWPHPPLLHCVFSAFDWLTANHSFLFSFKPHRLNFMIESLSIGRCTRWCKNWLHAAHIFLGKCDTIWGNKSTPCGILGIIFDVDSES